MFQWLVIAVFAVGLGLGPLLMQLIDAVFGGGTGPVAP